MQSIEDSRVRSDLTRAMHLNQISPSLYFRTKVSQGHNWKYATFRGVMTGAFCNEAIEIELIKDGYEKDLIKQQVEKGTYKHERIMSIKAKIEEAKGENGNG